MSSPSEAPIVDPSIVAELSSQLGHESVLDLIRLWGAEVPGRVDELVELRLRGDVNGVASQAHTIKGSSAMLGFSAISRHCAHLESTAKGGCMPGSEGIHRLQDLLHRSLVEAKALTKT